MTELALAGLNFSKIPDVPRLPVRVDEQEYARSLSRHSHQGGYVRNHARILGATNRVPMQQPFKSKSLVSVPTQPLPQGNIECPILSDEHSNQPYLEHISAGFLPESSHSILRQELQWLAAC